MEKIGDLPELERIKTRVLKFDTSAAKEKMLDALVDIRLNAPTDVDKTYLSRFFVQCTLPHRNPGNVPIWKRRNGNLVLAIKPGTDSDTGKSLGYPYGSLPRLLLFWMTTEAKRTGKRRLSLGANLSHFLIEVGLSPDTGGGVRSDAKRLRQQMMRLFRATVSIDINVTDGQRRGHAWNDMQVAPKGVFWWDEKEPNQSTLFPSWIELGEDFYNAAITSAVPYDMRALRALKRSPLALDLYALVNYLGGTLSQPHEISWTMLMEQMGSDVSDVDNFRRKASHALLKVRGFLPGVKVEKTKKGGIRIHPGKPAIARTTAKPQFPTSKPNDLICIEK